MRVIFERLMRSSLAVPGLVCLLHLAAYGQGMTKLAGSGIFDLLPGDTVQHPFKNLAGQPCWTNPNVGGVVLRTSWAKLQPAQNQYDWTFLDTGVASAQTHNKKISISVQGGVFSPNWIYTVGAKEVAIPGFGTMPVPWDPVFLQNWANLVQTLGARYDRVSVVAYVTMGGPGRHEEAYVCTTPGSMQEFNADGGVQAWVPAAEAILDKYAASFPNTPFLYAYGSPLVPTRSTAFSDVTAYGVATYPGRFGIKSDALHPATSPEYWSSDHIPALSPKTTVGYQMLTAFKGKRVKGGSLTDALNLGILTYKAHFIEVYDADCNNPDEQPAISAANQQLLTAYP
jgi:hypothetical protein